MELGIIQPRPGTRRPRPAAGAGNAKSAAQPIPHGEQTADRWRTQFRRGAEGIVRCAFITPDLHRIHHSLNGREQQRNLGQTFAWWDRFFGTYVPKSSAEGVAFRTGLEGVQDRDSLAIGFMLMEPFTPPERPAMNPGPPA